MPRRRPAARPLFLTLFLALLLALVDAHAAFAAGPNVTAHTKEEIIAYIEANESKIVTTDSWSSSPDTTNWSSMGELSSASKNSALTMLNNYRYIAGLNPVSLNSSQGELAQAAAFADCAIGTLTHYPANDGTKPDSMPDSLWQLGIQGASKTNIASGYGSITGAVSGGWMEDSDTYNIDRLGHRRWCLNPTMGTTGFGRVGAYTAMYSPDRSGSGSQTNVVWPARYTPIDYFGNNYAWNISTGTSISNPSGVSVTLTKTAGKDAGTSWTLNSSNTDKSGDYFSVNNGGYGQTGCIIFRPANLSLEPGDTFHVKASGVNGGTIEYDVEFFTRKFVESLEVAEETIYLSYYNYYRVFTPSIDPSDVPGVTMTCESSDESLFPVTKRGSRSFRVDFEGSSSDYGEATITVTVPGSYTKTGEDLVKTIRVVVPKSITHETINIKGNNLGGEIEYSGTDYDPQVVITDTTTGKQLVDGEDYTVEVSGNFTPNSYAYVTVKGINSYTGSKTYYTYITKKSLTEDMVTLSPEKFTYNGSAQIPAVSVKHGELELTQGTDYTVRCTPSAGGTNTGDYTLTITGRGTYYTGSCTTTFSIDPAELQSNMLSVESDELAYTGQTQMPKIKLTFNGKELTEGTDYTVSCNDDPINVGDYTYTVTGKGNFTASIDGSFSIVPRATAIRDNKEIVAAEPITYGQPLSDIEVQNAEFVAEGSDTVVEGTFTLDEPEKVLNAGAAQQVSWTFTPTNTNYKPLSGLVVVTVNKAEPKVLGYHFSVSYYPGMCVGNFLFASVGPDLTPGTHDWVDRSTPLFVPGGTYYQLFTPDDTDNYNTAYVPVTFDITKAEPVFSRISAEDIVYGDTLGDSKIDAVVWCDDNHKIEVPGTLTWSDPSIKPLVKDSDTTEYEVVFVPDDEDNIEQARTKITVSVAKAEHPDVMPSDTYNVGYTTTHLSSSLLPDNWTFDEQDENTELEPEVPVTVVAHYIGEDTGNYEIETMTVTVTRSLCDHPETELREAKEETCTQDGYSGDYYCTTCGELVEEGHVLYAQGHDWDEGTVVTPETCTEDGLIRYECSRCDETKEETIEAPGHKWGDAFDETETEATCTKKGVAVTKHICEVCHEEEELSRRDTEMAPHDWQWSLITAPTCAKEGREHQVCTVCNTVNEGSERSIDKLEHDWQWSIVHQPTCQEEGLKQQVCSACQEVKEGSNQAIPMIAHDYGPWKVSLEPTIEATGLRERTCQQCGDIQIEDIAKLTEDDILPTTVSDEVTPDKPVASEAVEKMITSATSDDDPKGSTFNLLQAKGRARSKSAVKVSWKRVNGATAYIVYGNKCGRNNHFKKIKTVKGTSFTQKRLKKGTYYKYLIVAVNGKKALATSKTIHVATKGGKVGNTKSVTAKVSKATIAKGKKLKLAAKVKAGSLRISKHRSVAYESSNPTIATVSRKGVVKGLKAGTCYVYAYAQDGVCKKVKVTVK